MPVPPIPVIVTSRLSARASREVTSPSSRSRPISEVSGIGNGAAGAGAIDAGVAAVLPRAASMSASRAVASSPSASARRRTVVRRGVRRAPRSRSLIPRAQPGAFGQFLLGERRGGSQAAQAPAEGGGLVGDDALSQAWRRQRPHLRPRVARGLNHSAAGRAVDRVGVAWVMRVVETRTRAHAGSLRNRHPRRNLCRGRIPSQERRPRWQPE